MRWICHFAAAGVLGFSVSAGAAIIGPTVTTSFTGVDSGGQRVNVDENNPIVLSAGTYTASQFSYFATSTSTNTTPFLAINSDLATPNPSGDINSFTIIAAGSTRTTAPVSGTNIVQTDVFGGGTNATFILTQATKVFAGVSSGTAGSTTDNNSIGYITSGQVDHNNPGTTAFTPTVGGNIPSFTNANLGRTYGFDITVNQITPEPAALSLLGLAGVGLLRRRAR